MRTDVLANGREATNILELGYYSSGGCSHGKIHYTDTVKFSYYDVGGDRLWGSDAGPDIGATAAYGGNLNCNSLYFPSPTNLITPKVIAPNRHDVAPDKINTESFTIIFGETCNGNNTGAGSHDPASFAIFYVLENGSNNGNLECLD